MTKRRAETYPLPNLRYWREKRGYSRYALAAIAGVHHSTIQRIEDGVNDPLGSTVRALARALRVEARMLRDLL